MQKDIILILQYTEDIKENETDNEYKYEHAGAEWTERGIRALEDWFGTEINNKGKNLRKIIRFSKMFCKSRDSWVNMPSGLIQTGNM